MELGFIVDKGYSTYLPAEWIEGAPEIGALGRLSSLQDEAVFGRKPGAVKVVAILTSMHLSQERHDESKLWNRASKRFHLIHQSKI
jgi:hypothetical protein